MGVSRSEPSPRPIKVMISPSPKPYFRRISMGSVTVPLLRICRVVAVAIAVTLLFRISEILKRRVTAMATATTLQIRSKGTVTLPIEIRRKYGLGEGDIITLIGLGDGSLLLTPIVTQVDRLGDRITKAM